MAAFYEYATANVGVAAASTGTVFNEYATANVGVASPSTPTTFREYATIDIVSFLFMGWGVPL